MQEKHYYRDFNGNILFSYNFDSSKIQSKPLKNEILDDGKIIDILKNNNINTWSIDFSPLKIHMVLATYFAGNEIYDGCSITDTYEKDLLTYNVFKKEKVIEYLSENLDYSKDLIHEMIGLYSENMPTDMFAGFKFENIEVTSNDKNCIEKITFNCTSFSFIHNLVEDNYIKSFKSYIDLENYIRYRFWGRAKLNGMLINLKN